MPDIGPYDGFLALGVWGLLVVFCFAWVGITTIKRRARDRKARNQAGPAKF